MLKPRTVLCPDISAALPDLPAGEKMSKRRIEKISDRTQAWLRYTVSADVPKTSPILACIPPIEAEQQQLYLSDLCSDHIESLSGLSIYDTSSALIIPQQVSGLPLLSIADPPTPQAILQDISLGIDLITVPFVTAASEQGIAFTFTFPPPSPSEDHTAPPTSSKQLLGIDLFSPTHATSVTPLSPTCTCYTCTRHHRAYIQHLLSAREMLAWTLLQIHNFHVLNLFFAAVRRSIRDGTFERDKEAFNSFYSEDLGVEHQPASDATAGADANDLEADGDAEPLPHTAAAPTLDAAERGPRLRGYQTKSLGRGEDKKREKIWGRFDHERPQKTKAKAKRNPDGGSISQEASTGTGTPAELDLGDENDQKDKVEEAKENATEEQREVGFTASDFEILGLVEKEETVRKD